MTTEEAIQLIQVIYIRTYSFNGTLHLVNVRTQVHERARQGQLRARFMKDIK